MLAFVLRVAVSCLTITQCALAQCELWEASSGELPECSFVDGREGYLSFESGLLRVHDTEVTPRVGVYITSASTIPASSEWAFEIEARTLQQSRQGKRFAMNLGIHDGSRDEPGRKVNLALATDQVGLLSNDQWYLGPFSVSGSVFQTYRVAKSIKGGVIYLDLFVNDSFQGSVAYQGLPVHAARTRMIMVNTSIVGTGEVEVKRFAYNLSSPDLTGCLSIQSIAPARGRYDRSTEVTITGTGFARSDGITSVRFGSQLASNVRVIDNETIKCNAPSTDPGARDVSVAVQTPHGFDVIDHAFSFTPCIGSIGSAVLGDEVAVDYWFDQGDQVLAVIGLPPIESLHTPPYDGLLSILPFQVLFSLNDTADDHHSWLLSIPQDPALSGLNILLQALAGPSLGSPKDAAWTNCEVLHIR